MLDQVDIGKILFLDIETVPYFPSYKKVPETVKSLWEKKAQYLVKEDQTPEGIYERAGIYAEFGKIICVSVGFIVRENDENAFRIKSFYGDDEKEFLPGFINLLDSYYKTPEHLLCAHNGKEFDFPYLARRILINGLKLPTALKVHGKKPWEVNFLDTMELWKFGDFKNYTSLNLLANSFQIPTPKDDIDGSDVGRVYWKDKDLERIVTYCQKDVLTVAQLLLRLMGKPLIDEKNIVVADNEKQETT